jgi:hypothetical protein
MRPAYPTRLAAAAALLAAAAAARAAPVPDAPSPLAQVPASAPVVVHLPGLRTLCDHVVAFLKNVDADRADQFRKGADGLLDTGFGGHKIRGVPKDGVIFLVFHDLKLEGEAPDVAIVAAVTDYATFRDNLFTEGERKTLKAEDGYESLKLDLTGNFWFLVDRKGYVVITPNKARAAAYTKKVDGLDGKISKEQAERFLQSDLGVYFRMDVWQKDYPDQLKAARQSLEDALTHTQGLPDAATKPLAALAKEALGPLFQAVDDSQGVLYTVNFRPAGLAIHAESELRQGSKTAVALKDFKPTAFKDLEKMPAGQIYYVGLQTTPPLFRLTGTMMFSTLTDPAAKDAKAVGEAMDDMLKAGPRTRLLGVAVPPGGVEIWEFDDPTKASAAQARLIEATGAALARQGVLKDKPEVKAKAQKYKDFDLTSARMAWDLDKLAAQGDGPKEDRQKIRDSLKKLLGDGLNVWFGTDGKTFVQVTAPDWDAARKQLDQYFKEEGVVGAEKAFVEARAELPAEATVFLLIDALRYADLLADAGKPFLEWSGVKAQPLPAGAKGRSGYVGATVTLRPERCSLDLFVSSAAVGPLYQNGYLSPFLPGFWR